MKGLIRNIAGSCLLVFAIQFTNGQVLRDTFNFNLLKQGVDYIYSLQFDKAGRIYEKMNAAYPGHPIPLVYKAMMTYWQYYPLTPTSSAVASFEQYCYQSIELCEKDKSRSTDPEFVLANIGARGLLLLYYADNDLSMNVISIAGRTYPLVSKSFDFRNTYSDFYFVTGLYNYYREAYPEAHPVYKAFAVLFPKGDKNKGLEELNIAARNGLFLKVEAFQFLTGIYISFENNFQVAMNYSKQLSEHYPQNPAFRSAYVKNLLLVKKYTAAEELIELNRNFKNMFYLMQYNILKGILLEKKYKDHSGAEKYYQTGIKLAGSVGVFADEYLAYAYFGLSRIMKTRGELKLSKTYYKKGMDLAAFKNVNFND